MICATGYQDVAQNERIVQLDKLDQHTIKKLLKFHETYNNIKGDGE